MPLFTVDETLCKRDGNCAAECPTRVIDFKDDGTPPSPSSDPGRTCINCGHCVAVCPHGALSLATMPPEACQSIDRGLLPSAGAFDHMARSRRSIRNYKQVPLPHSLLEQVIDTARYAPTGMNSQMTGWCVANGRKKTEPLAKMTVDWMDHLLGSKHPMAKNYALDKLVTAWKQGYDDILRGAPALVVAHAPKDYMGGSMDCHLAMSTFELAAFSQGLGACWAGFLLMAANSWDPLREALKIPRKSSPHAAMMLGYPEYEYHRIPLRKEAEITWL
jgi:nitroreductase/NAD-dependent dihydropyrimidine dehydrogenase PreA subunit